MAAAKKRRPVPRTKSIVPHAGAAPKLKLNPDPIERLRKICLAQPEAVEILSHGEPTFKVGNGRVFTMIDNNHHHSGHIAAWCNAPPMVQEILVESDPERFFRPPYVGHKGWVGVRLDHKVDWGEVARIIDQAYQTSAAKKRAGVLRRSR